jgi:2-iminobutanoate/2-iminopropanoate deaminase
VLDNLREVLGAAGFKLADVIKTTVFLISLADFETVNRIYGEHFNAPYPARSTVQVSALPRHARVEIEAIACR